MSINPVSYINPNGTYYYIFNKNVVSVPYQCVNYKCRLSIHRFYYNYKICGLLIQNFEINTNYQNQGYDIKLLDEVINRYKDKKIYLFVDKKNKDFILFCKNRKYKQVDKTCDSIIYQLN